MNTNIKELGKMLWKKKIYIVLITIIFAVTGICYAFTNMKFVATQKFLVAESENRIDIYKEMIQGSTILEEVIQNLQSDKSVQELNSLLEITAIENTNMLEVKLVGENEEITQKYLNEIVNVFLKKANQIFENPQIHSVDYKGQYYHETNAILLGISSGLSGLILSCLFFGICFLVDTKIKSGKEIEEITGLKSLISIPNIKYIAKKKLNIKTIRAHENEVFKTLMTNIQFVNTNHLKSKSIVVTSPLSSEGKTYVANNLAIEFAKAGKKVILIDGDMRKGRQADIFNLPNNLGLSNYLADIDSNGNMVNERITRFIKDTEIKNLNVITSGNVPPNPSELLKGNKIKELIKDLKVFYDIILFDTVAVLEAPEASMLSQVCDLSLILSAYGKTKKEDLAIAYEQMNHEDGSAIAVGLNKIPERKIKKKIFIWKSALKQRMDIIFKKIKSGLKVLTKLKKITKLFDIIKLMLKIMAGLVVGIFLKIKNVILKLIEEVKTKTEKVKEYIEKYKKNREKIKLIEAGSMIVETEEENNIIKEVFESEISKLESDDEMQYKKKLDDLKNNLEEKNIQNTAEVKETPKVRAQKSKFDLIREQQEKEYIQSVETITEDAKTENEPFEMKEMENSNKAEKEAIEKPQIVLNTTEKQDNEKENMEAIKERQKMEREKKEVEKRLRQEQINQYEEIDFQKQENLTEEMIRRQVEMDEMIRLTEKEEEEELLRMQQMKLKEKSIKAQERKEKFEKFKQEASEQFQNILQAMKNKKEENAFRKQAILDEIRIQKNEARIRKEAEKNENRVRIAQVKEERKAYKEMEKQKHREEVRIREELQEDNLYPKFKI